MKMDSATEEGDPAHNHKSHFIGDLNAPPQDPQ